MRRHTTLDAEILRQTEGQAELNLFKAMGFDRVFGPGTAPETTIAALYEDFGIEKPEAEEE